MRLEEREGRRLDIGLGRSNFCERARERKNNPIYITEISVYFSLFQSISGLDLYANIICSFCKASSSRREAKRLNPAYTDGVEPTKEKEVNLGDIACAAHHFFKQSSDKRTSVL
jgi:hypothetical protein